MTGLPRTFIESDIPQIEILQEILRHRPRSEMFYENLHGRLIRKGAILLVKSEMGWVKVDNE